MNNTALFVILAATAAAATHAMATDVGQHPAVYAPRQLPGIDPSTFIVGHPAGGAGDFESAHAEPVARQTRTPDAGGKPDSDAAFPKASAPEGTRTH